MTQERYSVQIAEPLSFTSDIMAESKALLIGLHQVRMMNISSITIEPESVPCHVLTTEAAPPRYIRELLQHIPHWSIFHIYREDNQAADALANYGADKTQALDMHPPFQNTL